MSAPLIERAARVNISGARIEPPPTQLSKIGVLQMLGGG